MPNVEAENSTKEPGEPLTQETNEDTKEQQGSVFDWLLPGLPLEL